LNDFKIAATKANIPEKVIDKLVTHFKKCLPTWESMIAQAFLSEDFKQSYLDLLRNRFQRIGL